jgi:hypothetical protein
MCVCTCMCVSHLESLQSSSNGVPIRSAGEPRLVWIPHAGSVETRLYFLHVCTCMYVNIDIHILTHVYKYCLEPTYRHRQNKAPLVHVCAYPYVYIHTHTHTIAWLEYRIPHTGADKQKSAFCMHACMRMCMYRLWWVKYIHSHRHVYKHLHTGWSVGSNSVSSSVFLLSMP